MATQPLDCAKESSGWISETEMMDYFQWCELVLSEYLAAARDSLQVRSQGLRPDQLARRIFGSEVVEKDCFLASSEWESVKQAIKDLDDEGCVFTEDDYYGNEVRSPGMITSEGEEFLEEGGKALELMVGDMRYGA